MPGSYHSIFPVVIHELLYKLCMWLMCWSKPMSQCVPMRDGLDPATKNFVHSYCMKHLIVSWQFQHASTGSVVQSNHVVLFPHGGYRVSLQVDFCIAETDTKWSACLLKLYLLPNTFLPPMWILNYQHPTFTQERALTVKPLNIFIIELY